MARAVSVNQIDGEIMETDVMDSKVNEEIIKKELRVLTPTEYADYSKSKGTIMGRRPDQKTVCTTEELRILINEGWTPEQVKDKHGLDDEELKQLVWKLSKEEQREKPIKFGKK